MIRRLAVIFACLAAASPAAAASSLTLEAYTGPENVRIATASNAVSARYGAWLVGGRALGDLGGFGIGVGADKAFESNGPEPWSVYADAGLIFDVLPSVRIEALGEIGRRGFESLDNFTFKDTTPAYSTYLGIRPGVSFKLLPTPIRFGVAAILRWPFHNGNGEPDYSGVASLGVEFGG